MQLTSFGPAVGLAGLLLAGTWLPAVAWCGEIPGIPAQLPPTVERDFELSLSNDFLGRGAALDDYRTQQQLVTARLGDRWIASFDHSILTLDNELGEARTDQFSASVGYEFLKSRSAQHATRITAGLGFRQTGDVAGDRIQNGFHRLVGSKIETMPYTAADELDGTLWIDAHTLREFYRTTRHDWSLGYWLRASSLLTSDGQWDNAVGAYLTANRRWFDTWIGVRQDWRSGYARLVEAETAAQEQDLALVFGIRFGALVFETVQQASNDASYGQLRLVSSGFRGNATQLAPSRFGIEAGFLVPDVQAQLSPRFRTRLLTAKSSAWTESVVIDLRYGEPQYPADPFTYIESWQLGAALEWQRPIGNGGGWAAGYFSVGAAWRSERAVAADALGGDKSAAAESAVATLGAGLRFRSARLGSRWLLRTTVGVSGWLGGGSVTRDLNGNDIELQKPAAALFLGLIFERS